MNSSQINPIFRFELYEGEKFLCLAYPINKPSLKCDADADVKISVSGNFVLETNPTNWLKARLKPYLIQENREYPLGEYVFTDVKHNTNKNGLLYWELKGMDLGRIVQQSKTEYRISYNAGEKYTNIVQEILISLGFSKIITVQSESVLTNDRADWEMGTSWLKIINTLLEEINYQSLWFDMNGNARIEPLKSVDNGTIDHTYMQNELSELKMPAETNSNIFKAYNVFTVMVSSPEYPEPLIATSVNDSPASKISTVNIGRIQAPIKKLDDIADQETLQKYVDNLKFQSMRSTEEVSFRTALNQHQVRDIIALDHPIASGIYQEIKWTMSLSYDGEMKHTAQRMVIE